MGLLRLNESYRGLLKFLNVPKNLRVRQIRNQSEICCFNSCFANRTNKCQADGVYLQQIRMLQYSKFGHGHTPTPLVSTIWYFIVGSGLFLSLFSDLPGM